MDPDFRKNIILTKTEALTMDSLPKDPKNALDLEKYLSTRLEVGRLKEGTAYETYDVGTVEEPFPGPVRLRRRDFPAFPFRARVPGCYIFLGGEK